MTGRTALLTWLLLSASDPAMAAGPHCPAVSPPPAGMERWAAGAADIVAGANAARATRLPIGTGAIVRLGRMATVTFAVPPGKPGDASAHGGVLAFDVATAGRYRIALDGAAWIDVVGQGKAVPSIGHGHGPDCSGIRKMVDFTLPLGRYLLQIAGSAPDRVRVMVSPLR